MPAVKKPHAPVASIAETPLIIERSANVQCPSQEQVLNDVCSRPLNGYLDGVLNYTQDTMRMVCAPCQVQVPAQCPTY